jgi:hypothetical protein
VPKGKRNFHFNISDKDEEQSLLKALLFLFCMHVPEKKVYHRVCHSFTGDFFLGDLSMG